MVQPAANDSFSYYSAGGSSSQDNGAVYDMYLKRYQR
jgi:hypothetical protein